MWGFPVKSGLASGDHSRSVPGVAAELSLILETSTCRGSAVIADLWSGEILRRCDFESDRNHNAEMFGPLDFILKQVVAKKLAKVIVGAGPGSYSGTRVGIAAAQGIAIACGCPAVAVISLMGMNDPAETSLAVGDARRGHWWWAQLQGRRMETAVPELGNVEDLQQAIDAAKAAGREIFSFEDPAAFKIGVEVINKSPDAAGLWQAWLEADNETREAWERAPAQPCYLKPPHITAPKRPWLQG